MLELLNEIDSFVWGPPLLVLLVGTGIWLTLRLNLLQVLKLPMALKLIFSAKNDGDGDVNSFKALCTALAATVGTGDLGLLLLLSKQVVPVPCSGCGWRHFLVWLPNMPKVFWR